MRVLVTGAAGFIGFHVAARLLRDGARVLGVDNLNGYYDPGLKRSRLALLKHASFDFAHLDIADRAGMEVLFEREEISLVIHLAAQAGVRHSIERPHDYIESNIAGFLNVLEGCRRARIGHLLYASSSSVYGGNTKVPFAVEDRVDHPISLYAATKKANELMAHSYSHLFRIPTTGLRFFTVYGPWGRPDMAPYKFARAITRGETIDIFNYGRMQRDFTYIDDIVEGVVRVARQTPEGYRLFNIGGGEPVSLMEFVHALEHAFGRRARKRFRPIEPGDMIRTHADASALERVTQFRPSTPLAAGTRQFAEWYCDYHKEELYDDGTRRADDSRQLAAAFRAS
ncbi:MAG TPA: NAD-dependent epimerase/dehydratase family protein [Bryobacteraceae bacterium]|jgi:UDP-glucuronate 4-epimerase|nr:NAD-dependent epimerase/dehydratase family protein [Bryobacteraceae bacterium]